MPPRSLGGEVFFGNYYYNVNELTFMETEKNIVIPAKAGT